MAGNILTVLVLFAKSANIFLRQKIALYGILLDDHFELYRYEITIS